MKTPFSARNTLLSVAHELHAGLLKGTIVLQAPAPGSKAAIWTDSFDTSSEDKLKSRLPPESPQESKRS
jgi:hypothetical protein